ncbi:MAG: hypothetical protein HRT35_15620 [Algicola sp.]|nr:hypothetical protein [Algicola sp.]
MKYSRIFTLSLSTLLITNAMSTAFATELVTNGGFENVVVTEGASEDILASSAPWQLTADNDTYAVNAALINPTTTQYGLEANHGNIATVEDGSIQQDLGVPLLMGNTYSVSVDIGYPDDGGFYGYNLNFVVNGTIIPLSSGVTPTQGTFSTVTVDFSPNAAHQALVDSGANIILTIGSPDAAAASHTHVDNLSVTVNAAVTTPFADEHNANTQINGALRLSPQAAAPLACDSAAEGSMYYDQGLQQMLICSASAWNEFKGEQGIVGDTGADGAAGSQGIQGDTGAAGADGATGLQGDTGTTGSQGIQGIQGETGAAGADGATGLQGVTGAQGIQGVQGTQGIAGTTHWTDGATQVTTGMNVGIGTSTPNAALEVVGNAIAATPTQDNHVVIKSYSDTGDQALQTQVDALVVQINQMRIELDLLNGEVFPAIPTIPPAGSPGAAIPIGSAIASSFYAQHPVAAVYDGVFSSNDFNVWISSAVDPAPTLTLNMGSSKLVRHYRLSKAYCHNYYMPGTWEIFGSNDNTVWTSVHNIVNDQAAELNLSGCAAFSQYYTIQNAGYYQYYQFRFVGSVTNSNYTGVGVGELEFYE